MTAQAAGMVLLALEAEGSTDKPRGGYLLGLNRVTFPRASTGKERLTVTVKKKSAAWGRWCVSLAR